MSTDYIDENVNEKNPNVSNKEIKKVNTLEGKYAYFSLADYHNIRIFKQHNYGSNGERVKDTTVKIDIENRLYLALLLFDGVIMHCSDLIRSKTIYDILENNVHFVENGKILFVFPNCINVIRDDYKKYILKRKAEYEQNDFSKTDVNSLMQPHMTEEFYEKVISLLEKTPFLLKKGVDGNSTFRQYIQSDLDGTVETAVMGKDNYKNSHVKLLNLTINQLLNLKYLSGNDIKSVFNPEKITDFITDWESAADDGAPFSRHTIVEQLTKENESSTGNLGKKQKNVIDAIETRLSMLYSKLNCGKHQIIEFHPAKEKRSIYNWKHFQTFLREIANDHNVDLDCEKVKKIRKSKEWNNFRNEFLACMAELSAKLSCSQNNGENISNLSEDIFSTIIKSHDIVKKYSDIREILLGGE